MQVVHEARRFHYTRFETAAKLPDDGSDVARGLAQTQKWLPSRFFYDARGSQLFDAICDLPEYYPTRTEESILTEYAAGIAASTGAVDIVELGSGSARKTRLLLTAYSDAGHDAPLQYVPIDVSEDALRESARGLLDNYRNLQISGFSGTYEQGLTALPPRMAPRRMVIFLGSSLGNFHREGRATLFAQLAEALAPGDFLLLGVDRHKGKEILEPAYNDAQGVTAAFNLNMLRHLNRLYGGNFVLDQFAHTAFYNESERRIELHLTSQRPQAVRLAGLDVSAKFALGETVRTEVSYKFELSSLLNECRPHGFSHMGTWTDPRRWFAVTLFQLDGQAG
jgi:dimethylhistidine N-methyltransferase